MEGGDSRFLHLHQPIRDLTKNWEVDVASQLGEYLEEVTGTPLSPFPEPKPCWAQPGPAASPSWIRSASPSTTAKPP
uniref:Condensin-2 complex subunit H2 n=1 Tax=Catharus ustulatus TaxID=91951 RepID=A0A8C3VBK2_CATUS